jgi:hypothetical protein
MRAAELAGRKFFIKNLLGFRRKSLGFSTIEKEGGLLS